MKREINFRMGRGRVREIRRAFSRDGYAAAWEFVHAGAAFAYMRAMGMRTI